MTNLLTKKSQRVRFEEVTPTDEIVVYFNAQLPDLIAGTGLPIFPGYDDLDNIQFAYITLPSGNTVVLGQYENAPEIGVDLYVELDRKHNSTAATNIPALVVETLRYLAISRETAVWFHPDYETEIEYLYSQNSESKNIPKIPKELIFSTEYEAIHCFFHTLEIYTRQKFPEHWAMLEHNLGLAYFNRSKGNRWDNLQKSIGHYYKSLEVFTQDKFPKKWQLNQEDLSQSKEALDIVKPNLVKDILDQPISGRYLRYINLSGSNLRGADLSGAILFDIDLSDSDLSEADLSAASLMGVNLSGANVNKAQFRYSRGISESMRQDLISRGAIFEDASGDQSESRALLLVDTDL
jgi:hypothetical protein